VKAKVLVGLAGAVIGMAMLAPMGQAQTPGNIAVLAVCNTEPETTAVLNNTDTPLTIFTLGSIKDPQVFEPIPVNYELAPGASVIFYLGPTSPMPVLSPQRIYDNTAPDEGALVVTSAGTLTALCGSGAGSLAGLGSNVAATATPVPASPSSPPTSTIITPPDTGDGGMR
jgi:hypothetical protein